MLMTQPIQNQIQREWLHLQHFYNTFTANFRRQVIISYNLNLQLKLPFYLLIIINNNPSHSICYEKYYKSIVNIAFLKSKLTYRNTVRNQKKTKKDSHREILLLERVINKSNIMRLRYFITEVFLCNGLSQHQSQLHIEGDKNTYERILMERYFSIQIGQNSTHPIGPIHTIILFFVTKYKLQTAKTSPLLLFIPTWEYKQKKSQPSTPSKSNDP